MKIDFTRLLIKIHFWNGLRTPTTTRHDYALFTFVLRRLVTTIQHLGLGELPLMRASAKERSSSQSLTLSFYFSRVKRDLKQTRKRKRHTNRQTLKKRRRNGYYWRSSATTSCVICDVSPKRPNLRSSFLHVES